MSVRDDSLEIAPAEARAALERGDVVLVDVREDDEWDAGRIAGARHLPLGRLTSEAATLDPARPVLFYCKVGSRSLMAAQAFSASGYDATSLAGGLRRWVDEGLPIEPEDGRVADH